jgi:hypothetical protein
MTTEPVIYTRSYVDKNGTFVCSHGSTFIERLYDRERIAKYTTSGANSDATEMIVEHDFKEAGLSITRTIDSIIILNHNLKDVTTEYWNGSNWQAYAVLSGLSSSHTLFQGGTVSTTKIRVRCSTTQSTNQEKYMAELIACATLVTIGYDFESYSVSFKRKQYSVPLADGGMHRSFVKFSTNRSQKYHARVKFNYVSSTVLETLRTLAESGAAFLWQPESVTALQEIFYVNWATPLSYEYVSKYKGAGFSVDMDLEEV